MPIVKITKEEIDATKAWSDGWYRGETSGLELKKNSKGDGYNLVLTMKVVDGTKEKELKSYFSLKDTSKKFELIKFHEATIGSAIGDGDLEIDTDTYPIGKEYWVHIISEPFQGNLQNRMDNWLPGEFEKPID